MADDIIDSYLEEDFDDDIPVVIGGKQRSMKGGQLVDAEQKEEDEKPETEDAEESSVDEIQQDDAAAEVKAGDLDLAAQYAEDDKEIHQAQEDELPNKSDEKESADMDQTLRDLTTQVEAECGVQFSDKDMQRRFYLILEAFFKDLRDAFETRSKLTMPTASGGMALTDEQAEKVISVLQSKRSDFMSVLAARNRQEKKKFVSVAAEKQLHEQDRAAQKEKDELDRLYKALTGEEPKIKAGETEAKPMQTAPKVISVQGKSRKSPTSEKAKTPQVDDNDLAEVLKDMLKDEVKQEPDKKKSVSEYDNTRDKEPIALKKEPQAPGQPPANLPVAKEGSSKPAVQEKPDRDDQAKPAIKDLPSIKDPDMKQSPPPPPPPVTPNKKVLPPVPPPKVEKPKQSTAPQPPPAISPSTVSGKPVMSDVQAVSGRLIGPVGELRSLSVKDFRRLSKDPKEATLKIKDKIDLLGEEQSFEVKTQGMQAWRESAVSKLYLEILRRSLEGIPIYQVISDMETKGEEALSKAEFDAVMKLNRDIRFG